MLNVFVFDLVIAFLLVDHVPSSLSAHVSRVISLKDCCFQFGLKLIVPNPPTNQPTNQPPVSGSKSRSSLIIANSEAQTSVQVLYVYNRQKKITVSQRSLTGFKSLLGFTRMPFHATTFTFKCFSNHAWALGQVKVTDEW